MSFKTENRGKLPIFFILARGRSGSTLLRTMLDANPSVAIPPESRFVQYLYYKYGKVTSWDESTITNFYNDILNCFETPDFDKEELKKELLKLGKEANFSVLCKTAYLSIISVFEKSEIKIIGDKNPRYSFFADKLLEVFPDAKFIHLTRDYRDSTLSFYKVKGMDFEKKNAAFLAYKWRYYNKQILKFKAKHPDRFYTIKYEELAMFPEKKLKDICSFLNIGFHHDMPEYHTKIKGNFSALNNEISGQIHSALLQPVNQEKIGIWEPEMEESDIKISDIIVGKYAELLGYERKYAGNGFFPVLLNLPAIINAWSSAYTKKVFYNIPFIMKLFYKFKNH